MANWRFLPPPTTALQTVKLPRGTSYTKTPGNYVDVPDHDGPMLRANGWFFVGIVGTTAERPATLPAGSHCFIDTTLNKVIFQDGSTWRDHTGAAV